MAHDEIWRDPRTNDAFGFGVDDDERVCLSAREMRWVLNRGGFVYETVR